MMYFITLDFARNSTFNASSPVPAILSRPPLPPLQGENVVIELIGLLGPITLALRYFCLNYFHLLYIITKAELTSVKDDSFIQGILLQPFMLMQLNMKIFFHTFMYLNNIN